MEALEEVRARRFTLVDKNGKARAVLSVDDEGPNLVLVDESGKVRAEMGIGKKGPWLAMWDGNGNRVWEAP